MSSPRTRPDGGGPRPWSTGDSTVGSDTAITTDGASVTEETDEPELDAATSPSVRGGGRGVAVEPTTARQTDRVRTPEVNYYE